MQTVKTTRLAEPATVRRARKNKLNITTADNTLPAAMLANTATHRQHLKRKDKLTEAVAPQRVQTRVTEAFGRQRRHVP
jgi:hypothetical protein